MRIALACVGLVMAVWGAVLVLDIPGWFEVGVWFVAGPLIHDLLVAPLVGVTGLFLTKGGSPVKAGAAITGVLLLLAIPLLWQENVPANPGLHDAGHLAGLAITVGVVWIPVTLVSVLAWRKHSRG